MVVCDSSPQAKQMFETFNEKYASGSDKANDYNLTSALILHDVDTKDERKENIDDFKDGKIDILFV
jgi:type I restriction enzyme R subunit